MRGECLLVVRMKCINLEAFTKNMHDSKVYEFTTLNLHTVYRRTQIKFVFTVQHISVVRVFLLVTSIICRKQRKMKISLTNGRMPCFACERRFK